MLSIIVPIFSEDGHASTVLIGRVSPAALAKIIDIPAGEEGQINSYIIDNEEQLIAHTDSAKSAGEWVNPMVDEGQSLYVPGGLGGQAVLARSQDHSREIVYITPRTVHSWYIAAVVPHEIVLNQALFFVLPLAALFFVIATAFYVRLDRYGRSLSVPITELARASRSIAKGGTLTTRVRTRRQDEIGELSLAFTDMQLALKGRLDELSLLLHVSQDISSSINITQSMPVILQGALRGTGAAGARVLILNPSGRVPLSFTEGPAGAELAALDRPLMTLLRENKELALGSPRQMRAEPGLEPAVSLPFKALYALPIQSNNKFQGVLFLGYRQVREFSLSERTLLRTLAGQAAVLVDNAYLFANAEGGRRRLAAVLASTSEAVIVTDQTDRILVINRAMERAFELSSTRVRGRVLADVIKSKKLAEALTQAKIGEVDLEIEGKDSRSYYVNVSPIVSQRGLVMGRVAVLTDVTRYKEIDRLKSDFVSNVSHDLRTPLTIMSGYATALAISENLSPEQREYTDNIILSVERMTGLVESLLDQGRIEAGVDLFFEEVDVVALLDELVEEHWLYARQGGVTIKVKAPRDLPAVTVDRTLLSQAVSNLFTNGFKYAPNSGEMILAAERVGEEVVISLHDNGPGIAGQDQMRLFEKFYRINRHGSDKVEGSGMGLAMVKTIADRHGGRAWCQSELGKGSTFCISVPIERADLQEPEV
jgi:PAS domain S-box-containing protein